VELAAVWLWWSSPAPPGNLRIGQLCALALVARAVAVDNLGLFLSLLQEK